MEHATLVWARTYENANRRLAAWGTVFGAFPGLDIVHRARKVHSNIDPLSRFPRILPHQSPAIDKTKPILEAISEQPIKAWESVIKKPALKAAFMATTGEDMLEASLEDQSAWAVTRRQARESGKDNGNRSCKRSEDERRARGKVGSKPEQLVVLIARGAIHRYIEGYLRDSIFKEHWRASLSTVDELVMTHQYYKNEDGLLFFWYADWRARLCVPHSLVSETLQEHPTQYNCNEVNQRTKLKDLRTLKGEIKYEVDKIPKHDTFEPETHLRNAFSRLRNYKIGLLIQIL